MVAPRVPIRMCVGCRGRSSKGELLRVVRSAEGKLRVDLHGSAVGRGAYVHRSADCSALAIGRGALERALRVGVSRDEAARLQNEIERIVGT